MEIHRDRSALSRRLPKSFVSRPRLLAYLDEVLSCNFLSVNAPSGWGVHSLLTDWCRRRVSEGVLVAAWSDMECAKEGVNAVVDELFSATRRAFVESGLVEEDFPIFRKKKESVSECVRRYVEAFAPLVPIGCDFVIVINEFDDIVSYESRRFIEDVITGLPSYMHAVVVSRTALPLRIMLRMVAGQCVTMSQDDLAFTIEEIGHFLESFTGKRISEAQAASVRGVTGGWPLALNIVAFELRRMGDVPTVVSALENGTLNLAKGVVVSELRDLEESDATLVLEYSLYESDSFDSEDGVLRCADHPNRLFSLVGSQLVYPIDEDKYRINPVFVPVLRRIALRSSTVEHRRILGDRFRSLIEQSKWLEALEHAIDFQLWDMLADSCVEYGEGARQVVEAAVRMLFDFDSSLPVFSKRLSTLCALNTSFEAYPPAVQIAIAAALVRNDDAVGALALLESVLKETFSLGEEGAESVMRIWACVMAIEAGGLAGFPERDEEIEGFLLKADYGGSRFLIGWALRAQGIVAERTGDLRKASERFGEAAISGAIAGACFVELMSSYELVMVLSAMGKLRRAEEYLNRVQERFARREAPFEWAANMIEAAEIKIQFEKGSLEAVVEESTRLRELEVTDCTQAMFVVDAWLMYARALCAMGDAEGALVALERALWVAREHGFSRQHDYLMCIRAFLSAQLDDAWLVDDWMERYRHLSETDDEKISSAYVLACARICIARGEFESVLPALEQLLEHCLHRCCVADSIRAQILLAECRLAKGETGLDDFRQAMLRAQKEKVAGPFFDDAFIVARFLDNPLAYKMPAGSSYDGAYVDFVEMLRVRLSNLRRGDDSSRSLDGGRLVASLTNREREVLHLLAGKSSYRDIASKLFISVNTVHVHCANIYSKLGVHSRKELLERYISA